MFLFLLVTVDIRLTTASYGSEISWSIGECRSNRGYGNSDYYTQTCYLTPGDYTLTCLDSDGDGWNGGYIEIDGERYCGSDSGRFREKRNQITITGTYLILTAY